MNSENNTTASQEKETKPETQVKKPYEPDLKKVEQLEVLDI